MQRVKDQTAGMSMHYPESISDRFHLCVSMWPNQIAVKVGKATLTYEELDKTSNRAAHAILRDYGPGAEPVLALFDVVSGACAAEYRVHEVQARGFGLPGLGTLVERVMHCRRPSLDDPRASDRPRVAPNHEVVVGH